MKLKFIGTSISKVSTEPEKETGSNLQPLRRPISLDELQRAQKIVRNGSTIAIAEGIWSVLWTVIITVALVHCRAPILAWAYLGPLINVLGSVGLYRALRDIRPNSMMLYLVLKTAEAGIFLAGAVVILAFKDHVVDLLFQLSVIPMVATSDDTKVAGSVTPTGVTYYRVASYDEVERLIISGSILCAIGLICCVAFLIAGYRCYRAVLALRMDQYCGNLKVCHLQSGIQKGVSEQQKAQPTGQQLTTFESSSKDDTIQYAVLSKSTPIELDI